MKMYSMCETVIGEIYIVISNSKVLSIHIGKEDFETYLENEEIKYNPEDPLLLESITQILQYFSGNRKLFNLPIEIQGTAFQLSVWGELEKIPYGETRSYQEIANQICNPKAVRAIGQANKANMLPIIIPCHRVIGKNQTLTGYAGSRTDIKEKLLNIEGAKYKNGK